MNINRKTESKKNFSPVEEIKPGIESENREALSRGEARTNEKDAVGKELLYPSGFEAERHHVEDTATSMVKLLDEKMSGIDPNSDEYKELDVKYDEIVSSLKATEDALVYALVQAQKVGNVENADVTVEMLKSLIETSRKLSSTPGWKLENEGYIDVRNFDEINAASDPQGIAMRRVELGDTVKQGSDGNYYSNGNSSNKDPQYRAVRS
jgi:hypothetical protein